MMSGGRTSVKGLEGTLAGPESTLLSNCSEDPLALLRRALGTAGVEGRVGAGSKLGGGISGGELTAGGVWAGTLGNSSTD